ncbi:unnamed protein product [Closterium sp. Yama58-4]|nr:unnamed protein product [Closterium sp. Yama58-4]
MGSAIGSSAMGSAMDPVQAFADLIGTPRPAATLLLASLAFVPIAWLHRFISSPTLRHLYCTVTGLLLSAFVFGWTANAHFFVCMFYSMAVMRLHVIMRTHETRTEGVLDCTGALTVLATKLSAVAYSYQDGLTLFTEKDEGAQAKDEKEKKELTEEQRRREERMERSRLERRKAALVTMPSVVEVMGYLFCFGLHITGPFFEFKAYYDWTRRQGQSVLLPSCRAFVPGGISVRLTILHVPTHPLPHHLQIWSPSLKQPLIIPPFVLTATVLLLISPSLDLSHISDRHKNHSFPFHPHWVFPFSLLCAPTHPLPRHSQIWSRGSKQPSFLPPLVRAFTQGVLAALVFLLISPSLDLTQISDPHKNRAYPFHLRWLLAHHACIVWRFRAYILWIITEAAMIVGGLGFSGWETGPKKEAGKGGESGDVKVNGGESEGGMANGKRGGDGDAGKQEGDKACGAGLATPGG